MMIFWKNMSKVRKEEMKMNHYNVNHIKINPQTFQHPADRTMTEKIVNMQVFQEALQFISKNSIEKQMGVVYRSSMAQLTPQVSPVIFEMLQEASEMFEVSVIPDVFLVREYSMLMTMTGIEKPMMLVSTEFLENLSEKTLWGILASEVSGIKNGFCEIKLVEWLCNSSIGILPDIVIQPLMVVFRNWHKYAQYSFDRAVLIATGDFNTAMQLVLTGEIPREALESVEFDNPNCEYMKQCREFLENDDKATRMVRNSKALFSDSPFYASRYLELFQFYQSQYYDLIEDYLD